MIPSLNTQQFFNRFQRVRESNARFIAVTSNHFIPKTNGSKAPDP
jgi:hypothetical protein